MINLNNLTVKYIEKIAQDCHIFLKKSGKKAEKIKELLKADISEEKLNDLYSKYLNEYISTKDKINGKIGLKSVNRIKELEDRIAKLEDQVSYIVSILAKSDMIVKEEKAPSFIESRIDSNEPKSIIKSILSRGQSISIDYLIKIKELQKFPIKSIELAIKELILERSINALEGDSIQKLDGNISILTRIS